MNREIKFPRNLLKSLIHEIKYPNKKIISEIHEIKIREIKIPQTFLPLR